MKKSVIEEIYSNFGTQTMIDNVITAKLWKEIKRLAKKQSVTLDMRRGRQSWCKIRDNYWKLGWTSALADDLYNYLVSRTETVLVENVLKEAF